MALPQFDHKNLREPQQRLLELEDELAVSMNEVEVAAAAIPVAEKADREAKSAARVDKSDPPAPTAEAAVHRREAPRSEVAEIRDAIETAELRLQQALDANRVEIRKGLSAAVSRDRAELDDLLAQVDPVVTRLGKHLAEDRAAAGKKYLPNQALLVPGLSLPNGDDRPAGEAIAALRALTRAPEPRVVKAPLAPLSTNAIGRALYVRDGAA